MIFSGSPGIEGKEYAADSPARWARIGGLILVLCGAALLLLAAGEVLRLYFYPDAVLPLARSIEQASAVDASLLGSAASDGADSERPLSYFLAWLLQVSLLPLIGKFGVWCTGAGGRLLRRTGPPPPAARAVAEPQDEPELPADYRPSHRLSIKGGKT